MHAHRFSYMLFVGDIPDEMCVLHKCDVPHCVNPSHLFLGTHIDNMADMVSKGRQSKGEEISERQRGGLHWTRQHPESGKLHIFEVHHGEAVNSAKLTETEVRAIRADERSYRKIAADYGIAPGNVWFIRQRKSWAHVD